MEDFSVVSERAVERRREWVTEIGDWSSKPHLDGKRLSEKLQTERTEEGVDALIDHRRMWGAIPELYDHDSSEEKLYSKYTDAVVSAALSEIGCDSYVLTERADAADVEARAPGYTLVADAKTFRLSRTAKNQKDFKVQAMGGWRRDKDYAVIVSPLYQLPSRKSQIYRQATSQDVCLLSFSHLVLLVRLASQESDERAVGLLGRLLEKVSTLHPSKNANAYWTAINSEMLTESKTARRLWREEKTANLEAIALAKREAFLYLAQFRSEILSLSREDAISRLLQLERIDGREQTIQAVTDNGLMDAFA